MIRVKDLTVKYGKQLGLKNVSITIPSDRITCILGPNGAGKTTLLKTIAKLVDYSGSIYLDGLEIAKTPLKTISRLVSYASQIYVSELLSLTVYDALLISRYPRVSGFFEREVDRDMVIKIAEELYLTQLLDRKLYELSSGELQRVVIGLALAKEPRYILFDELDVHVDIGFKVFLAKLVKKWREKAMIIFTTHDILFGSILGEYFILMDHGEVVYTGFLDELVKNIELLEKIYGVRITRHVIGDKTLLIPLYL